MMLPDKDAGSSFNVLSKTSARGQLKIFVRIRPASLPEET